MKKHSIHVIPTFFTLLAVLMTLMICESCNNDVKDPDLSVKASYYFTSVSDKFVGTNGAFQQWNAIDIRTREDYSIAMGMIKNSNLSESEKNSCSYLMSLNNQELFNSPDWSSYQPKAVTKDSEYKLGYTNSECAVATTTSALKRVCKMNPEPRKGDSFRIIPQYQLVYIGKVYGEYCNIVIIEENSDCQVFVARNSCINERTIIE